MNSPDSQPLSSSAAAAIVRTEIASVSRSERPSRVAALFFELLSGTHGDLEPDAIVRLLSVEGAMANINSELICMSIAPIVARHDPRFSFASYVPLTARLEEPGPMVPLLVRVHGSGVTGLAGRDEWIGFAERHACYVLAPIFPLDLRQVDADEAYKQLLSADGTRYDLAVIDMIDQLAELTGVEFGPIVMFGFSGGAQFAHRFALAHPGRLAACSVGAAGMITVPGGRHGWWTGTADMEAVFGQPFDGAAVARTDFQIVVGAGDDGRVDHYTREQMGLTDAEYEAYGATRIERARRLADELRALGGAVLLEEIDGAGHDAAEVLPAVEAFLDSALDNAQPRPVPAEVTTHE